MKGTIAFFSGDPSPRYNDSVLSLLHTLNELGDEARLAYWPGFDVTAGCNAAIRGALANGSDWLWFTGDDHVWPPTLVRDLLAHDVDVVVPQVLLRKPPYRPLVFSGVHPDNPDNRILADIPAEGLFEIHTAGSGGMLVRRRVLEAIEPPWFENHNAAWVNDDFRFCDKVREAGFTIWCDPEASFGHLVVGCVYPVHVPDHGWAIDLSLGGDFRVVIDRGDRPQEKTAADADTRADGEG